jgi:hypothetical protein
MLYRVDTACFDNEHPIILYDEHHHESGEGARDVTFSFHLFFKRN